VGIDVNGCVLLFLWSTFHLVSIFFLRRQGFFPIQISMADAFPRPFVITVGVPKGGECKTWVAFNLAGLLGLWGYDVLVVDANPMHDLLKDYQVLEADGIWPRFDVVSHDLLTVDGNQADDLDLSSQRDRDFIIYDTSQYVQLRTTKLAWAGCNLLILPITPSAQQLRNYLEALQLNNAFPAPRPALLVLPCRCTVLKNAVAEKRLELLLEHLKDQGCIVPPFSREWRIPDNDTLKAQDTRWIFSQLEFDGKKRVLSQDFLHKVIVSLVWIRSEIERIYGRFPAPKLRPIGTDDRTEMLARLAVEYFERTGRQRESAV
jgi:hypothetical protein